MKFNGPWHFDHGRIRNKDGRSVACVPVWPDGIGGPEDKQRAEAIALLPEIVDCLETLVKRIEESKAYFPGNEKMRAAMLADAKEILKRLDGKET